jgi:hypothetical protein
MITKNGDNIYSLVMVKQILHGQLDVYMDEAFTFLQNTGKHKYNEVGLIHIEAVRAGHFCRTISVRNAAFRPLRDPYPILVKEHSRPDILFQTFHGHETFLLLADKILP